MPDEDLRREDQPQNDPQNDDPQRDPVIFGSDPFTHERPPVEDEDRPTYRPPTRMPYLVAILIVVIVLVGAIGIFVF